MPIVPTLTRQPDDVVIVAVVLEPPHALGTFLLRQYICQVHVAQ